MNYSKHKYKATRMEIDVTKYLTLTDNWTHQFTNQLHISHVLPGFITKRWWEQIDISS